MNKKTVFSIVLLLSTASTTFYAAEREEVAAQNTALMKLELTRLRAEQEAFYLAALMDFNAKREHESKALETLSAIQEKLGITIAEKEALQTHRKTLEQSHTTQVENLNKEIADLTQKIHVLEQNLTESQANYEAEEAKYKRSRNQQNKEVTKLRKEEATALEKITDSQFVATQAQAAVIAAGKQLNETKARRLKVKGGPSWTASFGLATDTDKPVDLKEIESYAPKKATALPGAHESQSNS